MSDDPWGPIPEKQLHVYCPVCEKPVTAIEVASLWREWTKGAEWDGLTYGKYSFLRCGSCDGPLLVIREDFGDGLGEAVRLWPSPPRVLSVKIPESLRREVAEARACFDAKAYTAAVVMVRRTLEGVCNENKVTKWPLSKALQEMASQGLLDDRLLSWADGLRVLDNEGAHYTGSPVCREDAKDALAFAEAALDYLYVLTAQFEEFQQRRKSRADTKRLMPDCVNMG